MHGALTLASLLSPLTFGAPGPSAYVDFDNSDFVFYGFLGVGLILGAFFIKFIAKISVNKRVHGITDVSVTLDDVDRMRRTGLIDEDEYKNARRIVSENVVEAMMPKVAQPAEVALQVALQELEDESQFQANLETSQPGAAPAEPSPAQAQAAPSGQTPSPPPVPRQAPRPGAPPPAQPSPTPDPKHQAEKAFGEAKHQAEKALDEGKQLAEDAWTDFQMASEPPRSAKKKSKKDAGMPMNLEKLRASGAIDEAEYKRLRAYYAKRQGGS